MLIYFFCLYCAATNRFVTFFCLMCVWMWESMMCFRLDLCCYLLFCFVHRSWQSVFFWFLNLTWIVSSFLFCFALTWYTPIIDYVIHRSDLVFFFVWFFLVLSLRSDLKFFHLIFVFFNSMYCPLGYFQFILILYNCYVP